MKISVIGCGVMGGAFARHFAKAHHVSIIDKDRKKAELFAKEINAAYMERPQDVVSSADIILLAVKPKDLSSLAKTMAPSLAKQTILISILAGTTLKMLRRAFPEAQLLRVMPNLALTVGKGMIGIVEDGTLSSEKKNEIEALFQGLGLLYWLPEEKIDAFTALAASSPAFIYVMMEAMIEAGVFIGFSSPEARSIVIQTFEGAVALLNGSKQHPAELKLQIASPGGTTIAGLKEIEKSKMRAGIWNAVIAAYEKGLSMHEENKK